VLPWPGRLGAYVRVAGFRLLVAVVLCGSCPPAGGNLQARRFRRDARPRPGHFGLLSCLPSGAVETGRFVPDRD